MYKYEQDLFNSERENTHSHMNVGCHTWRNAHLECAKGLPKDREGDKNLSSNSNCRHGTAFVSYEVQGAGLVCIQPSGEFMTCA